MQMEYAQMVVSVSMAVSSTTETMVKTSELFQVINYEPDSYLHVSTNDVLALEIEAAGTQFEAGSASMEAFASLIDGDQWMIYRNTKTGVLHWDFVSKITLPMILFLFGLHRVCSVAS